MKMGDISGECGFKWFGNVGMDSCYYYVAHLQAQSEQY